MVMEVVERRATLMRGGNPVIYLCPTWQPPNCDWWIRLSYWPNHHPD